MEEKERKERERGKGGGGGAGGRGKTEKEYECHGISLTFSLDIDSYKESAQKRHFCLSYAGIQLNSLLVHEILDSIDNSFLHSWCEEAIRTSMMQPFLQQEQCSEFPPLLSALLP